MSTTTLGFYPFFIRSGGVSEVPEKLLGVYNEFLSLFHQVRWGEVYGSTHSQKKFTFLSLFHQVRWGEDMMGMGGIGGMGGFYPFFIRSGGVSCPNH